MNTLLFGASGLIGAQLLQAATSRNWSVLGTRRQPGDRQYPSADLGDAFQVERLLTMVRPQVIFLAAGLRPGLADGYPVEARSFQVEGISHIAQLTRSLAWTEVGASGQEQLWPQVVYFSNAEVFGDANRARREDDDPQPNQPLFGDQANAEEILRSIVPDQHIIVRTHTVFGGSPSGNDWANRIREQLRHGDNLTLPHQRPAQPTYVVDLAEATLELVEAGCLGTYHVVGPDRLTPFAFARQLAHLEGTDVLQIEPGPAASDSPGPAWLARHKLAQTLGGEVIRSTAEALRDWRRRLSLPRRALRAA